MQFLDKADIYPVVEFSPRVAVNIFRMKKEFWGTEQDCGTRLAELQQNLGEQLSCTLTCHTTRKFIVAKHFAKMERKTAKYNVGVNAYANLLMQLLVDEKQDKAQQVRTRLAGIDYDLHVMYTTEMESYGLAVLKPDRRFPQIFYNRFIPKNESIVLLFEQSPEYVRLYGIGKVLDLFSFSNTHYAIAQG